MSIWIPPQVTSALHIDADQISALADGLAGGFFGWVGSLLAVVLDLVTVVVFSFYIAGAGPRLIQHVAVWLPPDRQPVLGEIWDIAEQKTGGYVASKIVLAAASAFFHGILFWAIGLPGWLPLALLAGITAQFIPIIGTYIGVAVPVVVAIPDKPINAIWIVLFAIVYQQIETYVFTPKVSQRTMEVNPAIALAAVFIGAAIWGPIGAIIGVPIVAVVVSVVETYGRRYELVPRWRPTRKRRRATTARASNPMTVTDRADEHRQLTAAPIAPSRSAVDAMPMTMTAAPSATGARRSARTITRHRPRPPSRTDRLTSLPSHPHHGANRADGGLTTLDGRVTVTVAVRRPPCAGASGPRGLNAPRTLDGCGPSGDSSTMRCSAGRCSRVCAPVAPASPRSATPRRTWSGRPSSTACRRTWPARCAARNR